ncbi:MAG: hypothetical protein V7K38_26020 [Nostoc sp.]|uniref:hypothetical protein n=1 Tax=Nostoc sp. TaxID=1180 RepID=UPI002FF4CB79
MFQLIEASVGAFSTIPASDSSLEPFLGRNFSASADYTTLDGFCSERSFKYWSSCGHNSSGI